jgi:hypothetical protein
MKKIFTLLFTLILVGVFFHSCMEKEQGFGSITSVPDPTAGYYLQFINASKTMETGVTDAGALVDATSSVAVTLMGLPQTTPITVNLTPDPANTLTPAMYTLSANSITIPAGSTSGAVTFATVTSKMPVGQTLKFVLNMSAGEHNSPSATGIKLTYNVKRINFCPLVSGSASLVGSWSGKDAGYNSNLIKTTVNGTNLNVAGVSVGFINDFWGEEVVSGGSFVMTIKGNGTVDIPRQYIYTTIYKGALSDYEIMGSGKWENCGNKPVLTFTYDIYYVGDAAGLAQQYASYLGNIPYLTCVITMN